MTEYWVSQGNKWCDHCKIFIANNPTSIRTHEFGTRHTENVTKRLAAMRKDTVAKEKDKQQAMKDLTKIEAQALKSYEKDLAAIQEAEKRRAALSARRLGATSPSVSRPTENKGPDSHGKWTKQPPTGTPKPLKVSPAPESSKAPAKAVVRGVASSLAVGKRKRENRPGSGRKSTEEAAALAAREAARRRTEEREKSLLGLYQAY